MGIGAVLHSILKSPRHNERGRKEKQSTWDKQEVGGREKEWNKDGNLNSRRRCTNMGRFLGMPCKVICKEAGIHDSG